MSDDDGCTAAAAAIAYYNAARGRAGSEVVRGFSSPRRGVRWRRQGTTCQIMGLERLVTKMNFLPQKLAAIRAELYKDDSNLLLPSGSKDLAGHCRTHMLFSTLAASAASLELAILKL